ncbi:MAG: DUF4351 domain-containing protein [Azospirillaceae bacterium]|nr:DUF4351 domain-containing protein [Azospirillaceae bacterium]
MPAAGGSNRAPQWRSAPGGGAGSLAVPAGAWSRTGSGDGAGDSRGRRKGRQEGHREGHQEGRRIGEATVLRRLLERRFGDLPDWAVSRIAAADTLALEERSLRVLDAASLDEVLH